jgi:hypothetical protein
MSPRWLIMAGVMTLMFVYISGYALVRWRYEAGDSFTYVIKGTENRRMIVSVSRLYGPLLWLESGMRGHPVAVYRVERDW